MYDTDWNNFANVPIVRYVKKSKNIIQKWYKFGPDFIFDPFLNLNSKAKTTKACVKNQSCFKCMKNDCHSFNDTEYC